MLSIYYAGDKRSKPGTSLAVQWLRLCTSNARGAGSNPSQGTKIPHATQPRPKKKKKNLRQRSPGLAVYKYHLGRFKAIRQSLSHVQLHRLEPGRTDMKYGELG